MISKEDIKHLKNLARVEFGEEETKKLAKDLGDILGYIDVLKEADVSGAVEMTHSVDLKNVYRTDAFAESPVAAGAAGLNSNDPDKYDTAKELIDAFPAKEDFGHGTYLKVKPIMQ